MREGENIISHNGQFYNFLTSRHIILIKPIKKMLFLKKNIPNSNN